MLHSSCERGIRKSEINSPADANVSEGEGVEVFQAPEQRFPSGVVTEIVPLQPVEGNAGADVHPAAHGQPHNVAVCWQELQPLQRSLSGVGFLEKSVAHGGSMLEQSVSEGLYAWKGLMLKQFLKNCSTWNGLTLEKFMKDSMLETLHWRSGTA